MSPCPRERHPHCSPSSEQRYAQEMHDLSANVLCCKKLLTITWAVSGSQSCCYWGSGRDSHGCRPVRLATAAACVVGSFLTTPASSPRPRSSHPGVLVRAFRPPQSVRHSPGLSCLTGHYSASSVTRPSRPLAITSTVSPEPASAERPLRLQSRPLPVVVDTVPDIWRGVLSRGVRSPCPLEGPPSGRHGPTRHVSHVTRRNCGHASSPAGHGLHVTSAG